MMNSKVLFRIGSKSLCREENLVIVQAPVFFVCKDSDEQRYLVLLMDFDEDEYLICPVSDQDLFLMLVGKIPMRKPFLTAKNLYLVKAGKKPDDDDIKEVKCSDLSDDVLPDENAMFVIDERLYEYALKLKAIVNAGGISNNKFMNNMLYNYATYK